MNKSEFSKRIAQYMGVKQQDAMLFMKALEEVLATSIKEEEIITFQGFGTFTLWKQTARKGRNPKTGAPSPIPARNSIKFKPGKQMLEHLNSECK